MEKAEGEAMDLVKEIRKKKRRVSVPSCIFIE
jgi:hypothetical protein